MFPKCLAILVLVLLGLAAGPSNRASAQTLERATAKYSMQAMANLDALIKVENRLGYYFARNSLVLGGTWMDKSNKYTGVLSFTTEPGRTYVIVAAGDNDARDLDLRITDRQGNVIKQDGATDATARVQFTLRNAREIVIQVRLYDSRDSLPCFCAFAMLER